MWILDLNWVKDIENDFYKEDFCWMNFTFGGDSKPTIYGHISHVISIFILFFTNFLGE
jgi:hypothetical protein